MNSSGWDRFRKQQATEREQLRRLLAGIQPLLVRCRDTAPNEIELSARAAMLHSFHTGIENIFKRVAVELDGEPVNGDRLHRGLLKVTAKFGWQLEAWAVFSNHYHFIGHSPENEETAENLSRMLGFLHEKTAKWTNKLDSAPARKVWHNDRETRLTYKKSYLARLNYVHQNPVKHGLVPVANQYPWRSARWFERTAAPAQIKTIYRFKTDQLKVPDDFEVSPDW